LAPYGIWRCLAFGAVWHLAPVWHFAPLGPAQFGPLRRSGPAPFHASGALLHLWLLSATADPGGRRSA